jgi:hypothetical protein
MSAGAKLFLIGLGVAGYMWTAEFYRRHPDAPPLTELIPQIAEQLLSSNPQAHWQSWQLSGSPPQPAQSGWQQMGSPIGDGYRGHEDTFPCSTDPELIRRGARPCLRSGQTPHERLCFRTNNEAPGCP